MTGKLPVVFWATREECEAVQRTFGLSGPVSVGEKVREACATAITAAVEGKGGAIGGWLNEGASVFRRERFYPARRVLVVPMEDEAAP